MIKILFASSLLICVSGIPGFHQNGFNATYERIEVVDYNREYFSDFKTNNFKYNRTQAATNGTYVLIKDISSRLKIQIEAYKFASNEYRGFPILFSYNFCEAVIRDDYGLQELFKCGNLTVENVCPVLKKGVYFVCNFKTNAEKFPPNIPEGSYMLDIKWFHGPTEITFLQGYITIKNKF